MANLAASIGIYSGRGTSKICIAQMMVLRQIFTLTDSLNIKIANNYLVSVDSPHNIQNSRINTTLSIMFIPKDAMPSDTMLCNSDNCIIGDPFNVGLRFQLALAVPL